MTGTRVENSEELKPASGQTLTRGPIIISRHGRPALNRDAGPGLTWQQYVDWWAAYEIGALAEGQSPPKKLMDKVADAKLVLASGRLRAQQTAAMAAPHMAAQISDLYNEATLPPPSWPVKFKPRTWNMYARMAWMRGHTIGGETNKEAWARARDAAKSLHDHAEVGKIYLAAHGWFNRMLRTELKRLGWRCVHNGGNSYWSDRVYEWNE